MDVSEKVAEFEHELVALINRHIPHEYDAITFVAYIGVLEIAQLNLAEMSESGNKTP